MSQPSSKTPPPSYPEFAVRRETINRYFHPPLPRSTFHDFVSKGKILPVMGIRGFYRLNESLKLLGLREAPWVATQRLLVAHQVSDVEVIHGRCRKLLAELGRG